MLCNFTEIKNEDKPTLTIECLNFIFKFVSLNFISKCPRDFAIRNHFRKNLKRQSKQVFLAQNYFDLSPKY